MDKRRGGELSYFQLYFYWWHDYRQNDHNHTNKPKTCAQKQGEESASRCYPGLWVAAAGARLSPTLLQVPDTAVTGTQRDRPSRKARPTAVTPAKTTQPFLPCFPCFFSSTLCILTTDTPVLTVHRSRFNSNDCWVSGICVNFFCFTKSPPKYAISMY